MVIGFLESGHVDRALSYIRDSSGVEDYTSLLTNSGNLALDNVLSAGFMKAKRHSIQINYTIKCCGIFPMSDTDISSLFGNLLILYLWISVWRGMKMVCRAHACSKNAV